MHFFPPQTTAGGGGGAGGTDCGANNYDDIGYVGLEQAATFAIQTDWTFPANFIIEIDRNPNFVGTASSEANLVTLLNGLGLGTYVLNGTDIKVTGHHNYGALYQTTGAEVNPAGVLEISNAAPVAIQDVFGFSCRRLSEDKERATDAVFIAAMTPVNWLYGDPWPDPHSQWYHVEPLGGGDGPNYREEETILRGRALSGPQDGIGAVVYGYDWFLDYVDTLVALGVTKTVFTVNLAMPLTQIMPKYKYTYSSNLTASDPGSGVLKFDTLTTVRPVGGVVEMYISEIDDSPPDIAARIAQWKELTIYKDSDPGNNYLIYTVSTDVSPNPVDHGAWFTVTLIEQENKGSFTNGDAVTINIVDETSPVAPDVDLIDFTDTYAEWDFMMATFAGAGITVICIQFTLEMGITLSDDIVPFPETFRDICAKVTTDYWIPNFPAIDRSADAYAVDDTGAGHFPTFNTLMGALSVAAIRQYFHFWNYYTTYQLNRDRINGSSTIVGFSEFLDMFEADFPGKKVVFTQAAIKSGNVLRLMVGSGLIFCELLIEVVKENIARGNLIKYISWYDSGQIINSKSTKIYSAMDFFRLVRGMMINDGMITGTFTDVAQSASLKWVTVKRGLTAEVYVINPTAFAVTIPLVKLNTIAKNVSVESYYGEPTASTASHYLVPLGTSVLLQQFSLTLIKTL